MTVREEVGRGGTGSEHFVQFFDSDESRAENVAQFLAEGYRQDETLVLVARPTQAVLIMERLEALGVGTKHAVTAGRMVVQDAIETLRSIIRRGDPEPARFDEVVGKTMRSLASRSGLRAYGEMADLLAQQDEIAAATRLEELWNHLGEQLPFRLMCGYSSAHFVEPDTHAPLLEICRAHTTVRHHTNDPLGSWLLKTAGVPTGPDIGGTVPLV